ncbi:hypothetical protein AAEH84_12330 [Shewanella indica]|uniref:hypothetical protein n=1 Tax=Shewanella indica TaxID=768528 RepID=UPI001CFD38A4|nr:hypothetical protein [Shewanella indica]
MSFSPKLLIIGDIASTPEPLVQHGAEWLDARVDNSPSQPSDEQLEVYENYRMTYIQQTYTMTDKAKQFGKLNWLDVDSTEFDFSKLENIPVEQRLIFKLEDDFGLVFIHQSVIDLLKEHVKTVWVREV